MLLRGVAVKYTSLQLWGLFFVSDHAQLSHVPELYYKKKKRKGVKETILKPAIGLLKRALQASPPPQGREDSSVSEVSLGLTKLKEFAKKTLRFVDIERTVCLRHHSHSVAEDEREGRRYRSRELHAVFGRDPQLSMSFSASKTVSAWAESTGAGKGSTKARGAGPQTDTTPRKLEGIGAHHKNLAAGKEKSSGAPAQIEVKGRKPGAVGKQESVVVVKEDSLQNQVGSGLSQTVLPSTMKCVPEGASAQNVVLGCHPLLFRPRTSVRKQSMMWWEIIQAKSTM